MAEILLKVSAFVFIIILGAVLRRIGFLRKVTSGSLRRSFLK
ncbi:hypothetical protein [Duodenibacillus massiliensis]